MDMADEVTGMTTWLCKYSSNYIVIAVCIYFAVAKTLYLQTVYAYTDREITEMEKEMVQDDGHLHPPPPGPPSTPSPPAPPTGPKRPPAGPRAR